MTQGGNNNTALLQSFATPSLTTTTTTTTTMLDNEQDDLERGRRRMEDDHDMENDNDDDDDDDDDGDNSIIDGGESRRILNRSKRNPFHYSRATEGLGDTLPSSSSSSSSSSRLSFCYNSPKCMLASILFFLLCNWITTLTLNVCFTAHDELNLLNTITALGPDARGSSGGPIPLAHAHSHNDYMQAIPLTEALAAGFCSVEADVYLVNGRLILGHLSPGTTSLEDVYLRPLLERMLGNEDPISAHRIFTKAVLLGVCHQLTLLVDLKSESESTWDVLETLLKTLNQEAANRQATGPPRPFVACYDNTNKNTRSSPVEFTKNRLNQNDASVAAIRVVVTGVSQLELFSKRMVSSSATRCTSLDGRGTLFKFHQLPSDDATNTNEDTTKDSTISDTLLSTIGLVSDNWNSAQFSFPTNDKEGLRKRVAYYASQAHSIFQAPIRLYDTPENVELWNLLLESGVDVINTDRIFSLHSFLSNHPLNVLD